MPVPPVRTPEVVDGGTAQDAGEDAATGPYQGAPPRGVLLRHDMPYWFGDINSHRSPENAPCVHAAVQDFMRQFSAIGLLSECDQAMPLLPGPSYEHGKYGGGDAVMSVLPKPIVISPFNHTLVYIRTNPKETIQRQIRQFAWDFIHIPTDQALPYRYPREPLKNDPHLPTLCSPGAFWLSPDSDKLVYQCEAQTEGYYRSTGEPYTIPDGYKLVYLGAEDHDLLYGSAPGSGNDISYAVRDSAGNVTHVAGSEGFPDLFKPRMVWVTDASLNTLPWDIRAIETGFLIGLGKTLFEIRNDGTLAQRGRYAITAQEGYAGYSCPQGGCSYTIKLLPTHGHVAMDPSGALWCRVDYRGGYIFHIYVRLTPDEKIEVLWPNSFDPEHPVYPEGYQQLLPEPYIPFGMFGQEGYYVQGAILVGGP